MVVNAVELGEAQVLHDVRKILADPDYTPKKAAELCNRLLVTCYMGRYLYIFFNSYLKF
jgi:NAD+ synthase (glutamine-hydrolysing)